MAGPLFGDIRLALPARVLRLVRRKERTRGPWRAWARDYVRVLPYLRPYWRLQLSGLALIGVSVVVGLLTPWPLAIIVDTVLGNQPLPSLLSPVAELDRTTLLVLAALGGLVLTGLENGVTVVNEFVTTKLDQRMSLDFRSDLFRHAQRLSLAFHDSTRTGGLMYQIRSQADAVGGITVAIPPLLQSFLLLGGMFWITFKIHAGLALLSLSVVPFIYYSVGYYAKRIEPRLIQVRGLEGQTLSIIHEAMAMLRVIVAFGRESHEYRRFRDQGETAVDARVNLTVRQTMFSLAVNTITAAGTALVLGFGAWNVLQGELTAGELLVVMGYIAAIYQPLQDISSTIANLQEQFVNLRHALQLLDLEPEVKEDPDAVEIDRAVGRIRFSGVSFAYRGRQETLAGISFDVEPGQRVAIVGPTGAGKTTLISLLPRFYDPAEGTVSIDGIDLRKLKLASLRDQISIVLQEPLLFSGTIADNIRYGRLDAGKEEIELAALSANAHDFVSNLPDGYRTTIGERGAQLSGGERQRLAVARAFLKDAPILILDEPTSSIDSKTEAVILEALERLMEGRTTFMIAHRLSTVRSADLVLVMNQGRIVEQGSHEELLRRGGLYAELHAAQTRMSPGGDGSVPAPVEQARVAQRGLVDSVRHLLGRDGLDAGLYAEQAQLRAGADGGAGAPVEQARVAARALVESVRHLLGAGNANLAALAEREGESEEVRRAAGLLAGLTPEQLDALRDLDDSRLGSLLAGAVRRDLPTEPAP